MEALKLLISHLDHIDISKCFVRNRWSLKSVEWHGKIREGNRHGSKTCLRFLCRFCRLPFPFHKCKIIKQKLNYYLTINTERHESKNTFQIELYLLENTQYWNIVLNFQLSYQWDRSDDVILSSNLKSCIEYYIKSKLIFIIIKLCLQLFIHEIF